MQQHKPTFLFYLCIELFMYLSMYLSICVDNILMCIYIYDIYIRDYGTSWDHKLVCALDNFGLATALPTSCDRGFV